MIHPKKEESEFRSLAKKIGYEPNNIQHFIEAFDCQRIHSDSDGANRKNYGYSAMATVGDAVLKFILAECIFEWVGDKGRITQMKAELEKDDILSTIAKKNGFKGFYYTESAKYASSGSMISNKKEVSNQFEAVVFAIYKDLGLQGAQNWVKNWFIEIALSNYFHQASNNV